MKHVFFDWDGTLQNFKGQVPESAKAALKQLRAKGNKALICSGRPLHQITPWMWENFDGIICATGSVVHYDGKIVYGHFVPQEDLAVLRKAMDESGAALIGQCDDINYISEKSMKSMTEFFLGIGKPAEQVKRMFCDVSFTDTMEDYSGIRKFFYTGADKNIHQFQAELGHLFDFEAASFGTKDPGCGEVICHGINKAYGMQKYLEYVGASQADCVAIGDGPNDLEMMNFVGYSVAMGNGTEEVKRIADFVTKDIDDDGVAYALESLGLL